MSTPLEDLQYLHDEVTKMPEWFADSKGVLAWRNIKAALESIPALEAFSAGAITRGGELLSDRDRYRTIADGLAEALEKAIRQNECDMVLTGDELRACSAALTAYRDAVRDTDAKPAGTSKCAKCGCAWTGDPVDCPICGSMPSPGEVYG